MEKESGIPLVLEDRHPYYIMGVDLAEVGSMDRGCIIVLERPDYGIRIVEQYLFTREMSLVDASIREKVYDSKIKEIASHYSNIKILKETK